MMVVTEILKNLVNKGVLIARDGRLLSISIDEEDRVQVNPFNNDDEERPTIANLTIERNGNTEEIITLKNDRLERIVNTAQNVLNAAVNDTGRGRQSAQAQRATVVADMPEMRRNADGSISVHRTVGPVRMWAPATPAEAAQFEQAQQQQAQQDQPAAVAAVAVAPITDSDTEVEVEDSPADIVMVSVVENNGVRVRRMTREEAENQDLAIVSVIERR